MTEYLTSRSRILTRQRCARARYWSDEAFANPDVPGSGGFEPVKVAIPLATGGAVHAGLKTLMLQAQDGRCYPGDAVEDALDYFRAQCAGRSLDIEALEQESFVYAEQLALTEALVRLVGTRVMPKVLELYEVLEVEWMDVAKLWDDEYTVDRHDTGVYDPPSMRVMFRSIPDALVRSRADGDLYVISWKTTSAYDQARDQDARTDMQGLSECWALERRLEQWSDALRGILWDRQPLVNVPEWFGKHVGQGGSAKIRGVQMIYLVKGPRPKDKDGTRRQNSPLIRGLRKLDLTGLMAPEFATERFYTCNEPHPFRWAKGGQCPGGVNHKRGDEWQMVNMWETYGGVKAWFTLLDRGGVGPAGNAALESAWVMPVPHYRTAAAVASWERQTRSAESRHARDLALIRQYEAGLAEDPKDDKLWASWNARLDELFPQTTERCGDWFHRRCPNWELCHGPAHVAQDPVGSGLYQIKSQYVPTEEMVNG